MCIVNSVLCIYVQSGLLVGCEHIHNKLSTKRKFFLTDKLWYYGITIWFHYDFFMVHALMFYGENEHIFRDDISFMSLMKWSPMQYTFFACENMCAYFRLISWKSSSVFFYFKLYCLLSPLYNYSCNANFFL